MKIGVVGASMVYYIDYFYWVVACSFLVWFILLVNIKNKAIVGVLLALNFGIMYFPRIMPVKSLKVLSYDKLDLDEKDGKIMDNMVSFSEGNYYVNDRLTNKLEPGIYKEVGTVQTNELVNMTGIKVYVHVNNTCKDVWVQGEELGIDSVEDAGSGENKESVASE